MREGQGAPDPEAHFREVPHPEKAELVGGGAGNPLHLPMAMPRLPFSSADIGVSPVMDRSKKSQFSAQPKRWCPL